MDAAETHQDAMPGWRVVWALKHHGGSLHLSPEGKLLIRPKELLASATVREAVQQHLPFLLVVAAIEEVKRLLVTQERCCPTPSLVWEVQALNAACAAGDVEATRREAVAYVQAWQAWIRGETA